MSMSKEEIKVLINKAQSDSLIASPEQAQEAIDFVANLLDIVVRETEANEPYATNSIREYQDAYHKVINLGHDLEEHFN